MMNHTQINPTIENLEEFLLEHPSYQPVLASEQIGRENLIFKLDTHLWYPHLALSASPKGYGPTKEFTSLIPLPITFLTYTSPIHHSHLFLYLTPTTYSCSVLHFELFLSVYFPSKEVLTHI